MDKAEGKEKLSPYVTWWFYLKWFRCRYLGYPYKNGKSSQCEECKQYVNGVKKQMIPMMNKHLHDEMLESFETVDYDLKNIRLKWFLEDSRGASIKSQKKEIQTRHR